ncbi:hypothetical protein HJG54_24800 [Leptolyngbya sp. NK1-12]|uniref:Uncharacterized protein n=1 Tax=Leptolyngbya sp. NK1-12 TaxID=2547451 RepID=A0AA96WAP7_9CYAN|nr:hypothetical protein [Leptolyngbya sp. NK1-12]WNZ21400.1 hypothetical protein HJG54_24800 [Leptolyngbya sp. NK1-12]
MYTVAQNWGAGGQFIPQFSNAQIAYHLVRESQFFIEWTVPTIDLNTDLAIATELVDLQRQLSAWKLDWSAFWESTERQTAVAQIETWIARLQAQARSISAA